MILSAAMVRLAMCGALCCAVEAATYVVDQRHPNAADASPGTHERPFKTLTRACHVAQAGDTVYIKQGVYREPLQPRNSGREGAPITFAGWQDDVVTIKGSEPLAGFAKEGALWVKRPWTLAFPEPNKRISEAPFKLSAGLEQIFVNDRPLDQAPTRADLAPGRFFWFGNPERGELVIHPPEGLDDPEKALIEMPTINNIVGAWQGDPRGWAEVRKRAERQNDPAYAAKFPAIHYIHIKNLRFRHGRHTLNRAGVRLDGEHWLLEGCTVEYMNADGVQVGGDYGVVRNCVINHNGQGGFTDGGAHVLFENCITMYNNRKLYRHSWGGSGNKLAFSDDCVVRGLISCFNWGSGIWYDIDCQKVLVEDSISLGNRPVNGGFFYEVSWDSRFRRNISFANGAGDGNFYAAGFVVSCSDTTRIEDNIVFGSSGGLSVGGGRKGAEDKLYTSKGNRFINNLVVEPASFTVSVRQDDLHDAVAIEADNRFVSNTFLVVHGNPRVILGNDALADPTEFDGKFRNASGNVYVREVAALESSAQARVDEAIVKILNVLRLAEGGPSLKVAAARLKDIWSVGTRAGGSGYWVEADGTNYLMVYLPQRDSVHLFADAERVELWDFPPIEPARRQAMKKDVRVFSAAVVGPFALIAGLDAQARPMGGILKVRAEAEQCPIREIMDGKPFDVVVELCNPFPKAMAFSLTGPELNQTIALDKGQARASRIPMTAGENLPRLEYTVKSDTIPSFSRSVGLTIFKPLTAGMTEAFVVAPESKRANKLFGGEVTIASELQRQKEIYDVATGAVWEGRKDLAGVVQLGWNSEGLCIVARVADDAITPNAESPWDGDCLEIFVDGRAGNFGQTLFTKGCFQLFCLPPVGRMTWQPLQQRKFSAEADQVTGRSRNTADGYEMEILVPWALCPEFKPREGALLGLDFALDDADGKRYRKTQMLWKGRGQNFRDASLFGRVRLGPAARVDLGMELEPHHAVTRTSDNRLAVFDLRAPGAPLRVAQLHVEGRYAKWSSGGACFDSAGDFYFLDGLRNLRLQWVPAGKRESEVLYEFPDSPFNPYFGGANLLAPEPGLVWAYLTDGSIRELRIADGSAREVRSVAATYGAQGGGLALSPCGKYLVAADNSTSPTHSLGVVDVAQFKRVFASGSASGAFNRPSSALFLGPGKPFLAVCSESLNDAPGAPKHIVRLDWDPAAGRLSAPVTFNTPNGKAWSLVKAEHHFDAIAEEPGTDNVLVSCRQATRGATVYRVPGAQLAGGGLGLADLTPHLVLAGMVRNIAVRPAASERPQKDADEPRKEG